MGGWVRLGLPGLASRRTWLFSFALGALVFFSVSLCLVGTSSMGLQLLGVVGVPLAAVWSCGKVWLLLGLRRVVVAYVEGVCYNVGWNACVLVVLA